MSSHKKSEYRISAKNIGPIFELNAKLTEHAQNLIFARNGTGKSFLSRAFRELDLHQQGKTGSDAALNLVSEEAVDGKGNIKFSRGDKVLGKLSLEKKSNAINVAANNTISVEPNDTIFHVFSKDFVSEELDERKYEVDGKIENMIAVDSDIIDLKEAAAEVELAQNNYDVTRARLAKTFEDKKLDELITKAGISKRLKEYIALTFEETLAGHTERPAKPQKSQNELTKDLASLRSIPSEPAFPEPVHGPAFEQLNVADVSELLARVTSSSSVSSKIKERIEAHHEFFRTGVQIVKIHGTKNCPFCKQSINGTDARAIIDAYIKYFADEEEKHRAALRGFLRRSNTFRSNLEEIAISLMKQRIHYDELKIFVPSQRGLVLKPSDEVLDGVTKSILELNNTVNAKMRALADPIVVGVSDFDACALALSNVIEANNTISAKLKTSIEMADSERKSLQREACRAFGVEFVHEHWNEIEMLRSQKHTLAAAENRRLEVERSGPLKSAKDRVAKTFDILLKRFFKNRYVFDKKNFVLKRKDYKMARGAHRTLSEGEKTIIAFCYFIASAHRKVKTTSDYQRLFFVFDDPVTSLSYDYIFSIAQTLKNINITTQDGVSVNPPTDDGSTIRRPNMLVLTHSSYFFRLISRIVCTMH